MGRVTAHRDGLHADGTVLPLYSGSFHYWRNNPATWPAIFDGIRDMGFTTVDTYVPWAIHELAPAKFDFGSQDPGKDLGRWLDLCFERGLHAIIRPGPHINAELTDFGFPGRLFGIEEILARTASGSLAYCYFPPKHFPVFSYASDRLFDETRVFFKALAEVVVPRQYPDGPIVAVQCDNELGYFFRSDAYDLDYCAASLAKYRAFLRDRYNDVGRLNETYGGSYGSFDAIEPPRRFDARSYADLPWYLDWTAYREHYINSALARFADIWRECGMTRVAFTHNYVFGYPQPAYNLVEAEQAVDVQGVDLYNYRTDYDFVKRSSAMVAGSSRMPFIPEFGSGSWFWVDPITVEDQRVASFAAAMHGVKAMNYYMIVERERWLGSPLSRDGRRRPRQFQFFRQWNELLRTTGFHRFSKRADVLLLQTHDYVRLEHAAELIAFPLRLYVDLFAGLPRDFSVSPASLGFREPIQFGHRTWWAAWYEGLSLARIGFSLGDTELPLEVLIPYRAVVVPTFEFLSTEVCRRLLSFAERGGTVILGPRWPSLDEQLRPSDILGQPRTPIRVNTVAELNGLRLFGVDVYQAPGELETEIGAIAYRVPVGQGSIYHAAFSFDDGDVRSGLGAPIANLVKRVTGSIGIEPVAELSDSNVEVVVHQGDSQRRLVFLANARSMTRTTTVRLAGAGSGVDLWTGERVDLTGIAPVEIAPFDVRMVMSGEE